MSGRPCVFGEVLFDHFPDGRRVLGGAPFNVAWHLQAFGERPFFISRVGEDAEGTAIRTAMQGWAMDTSGLQADGRLPTGRVQVRIANGEPAYDIVHPAAWDAVAPPAAVPAMTLLYHGTLALRDATSQLALQHLRHTQPPLVFVDVNLRSPWWRREQVLQDISGSHWVKLNRDELDLLAPGEAVVHKRAQVFVEDMGLRGLLLTDGADGAKVFTAAGECWETRPAGNVAVVDTVGAGDALAAVMVLGLLRDWPLEVSLERAQGFASALVGQRGATVMDPGFYAPFIEQWLTGQGRGPAGIRLRS
jgi:fructokinase